MIQIYVFMIGIGNKKTPIVIGVKKLKKFLFQ